jgi:hypothetical protein
LRSTTPPSDEIAIEGEPIIAVTTYERRNPHGD